MSEHHPLCPESQGADDMCACRLIEEVLDYVEYDYEAAEKRGYDRAVEERVNRVIYDTSDLDRVVQRGFAVGLVAAEVAVEAIPETHANVSQRLAIDFKRDAIEAIRNAGSPLGTERSGLRGLVPSR